MYVLHILHGKFYANYIQDVSRKSERGHSKSIGKLKVFPNYGFLKIIRATPIQSLKYGRSKFPYYRKNFGKPTKNSPIDVLLKILKVKRKYVDFPKNEKIECPY